MLDPTHPETLVINLGKITNHHIAITDEEANMLVNALLCFHAIYKTRRTIDMGAVRDWQDVADDCRVELADELATKIATATRPLTWDL